MRSAPDLKKKGPKGSKWMMRSASTSVTGKKSTYKKLVKRSF